MSKELNQRILDAVASHLLTQKKKSTIGSTNASICAYRGDDGTKCAIGCLITDEQYSSTLEGRGIGAPPLSIVLDKSLGEVGVYAQAADTLHRLQVIHDFAAVENWANELYGVAKLNGLEVPACVQAAIVAKSHSPKGN